jgi:phosphotransacetylase
VFRFDVPMYHKPLLITDAALNIAPDAAGEGRHPAERDRSRPHPRHVEQPKVAILSAVETVNPEDPVHARRRRAVQDGRSRPDQGRPCSTVRWPSTTRCR